MSAAADLSMSPQLAGEVVRVQASCGTLAGRQDRATGIVSFRGIPYAQPPVGALRWRSPQPVRPWTGERDAARFGDDCPQKSQTLTRAPAQSEDCLYLNVWAPPGARAGAGLPVMVWLHGGSFVGGSGADLRVDGSALASLGVVVVTLNYRVGLFGFLAHPGLVAESAEGSAGNYGLLDQVAALQWVRDNIAAFGGDAGRVTLFGCSAGSASASLLLTSPLARGLFQRAILQSPGAARPLASLEDAQRAGATLGDLSTLRATSAEMLLPHTGKLNPQVRGLTTPRVLRPIRDGWLLPEDERPVFKAGRLHPMPLLVGSNLDEGSLLTASWPIDDLAAYEALLRDNFGDACDAARQLYPARTDAEVRPQVAQLFADTQFNYGTRLLAQAMSAAGQPTWRYVYTRRRPGQTDGPHHGEEVAHVFGNLAAARSGSPAAYDDTDVALSRQMMAAWTAFAATGNPHADGGLAWPAYAAGDDLHLELGDTPRTGHAWRAEPLNFLDRFYDRRTS